MKRIFLPVFLVLALVGSILASGFPALTPLNSGNGVVSNSVDGLRPTIGPAIPADPVMDPASKYNASTGLDLSAVNYAPLRAFREILVPGGTGGQSGVTIKAQFVNGGYYTYTVTVAANDFLLIEADFAGIYSSGTSAVHLVPFF